MSSEAAAASPPRAFVVAWAATLGVLIGVTWPLWTPLREVPRLAPMVPLGWFSPAIDFVLLAALGFQLVGALWPKVEPARWSLATAAVALAGLMAFDQLRWQPWAYHALLAAIVLATCSARRATVCLRVIAIAVYAYSAISKFDAEFAATLGSQMLGVLGGDAVGLGAGLRQRLALALPLGELAVAAALAASTKWARIAWPACVAAVAMHATTVGVLGPWGLGHSLGVLLWNVGFAWQTVVLFRPNRLPRQEETTPSPRHAWLGYAACGLATIAPLATPLGGWDQWPGWALYAPGGERATLYVDRSAVGRLPRGLRPHVEAPADPTDAWHRVRLKEWVLADTRSPLYPQNRVAAALTKALIEKGRFEGGWLLVIESPADRLTRERTSCEVSDRESLDAAASLIGLRPKAVWTDRNRRR